MNTSPSTRPASSTKGALCPARSRPVMASSTRVSYAPSPLPTLFARCQHRTDWSSQGGGLEARSRLHGAACSQSPGGPQRRSARRPNRGGQHPCRPSGRSSGSKPFSLCSGRPSRRRSSGGVSLALAGVSPSLLPSQGGRRHGRRAGHSGRGGGQPGDIRRCHGVFASASISSCCRPSVFPGPIGGGRG